MAIIEIEGLAKSYRVYQKQEGLLASVRGLFHRAYREVSAVRGIDLTVGRWDTPEHRVDDPLRLTPEGKPHDSVHDVQMALDGE